MVKEQSYIVVESFMINKLNLKGNELLIYAIIYGFSQDGNSYFYGSLQYLENWTNSTRQGVLKALKKLQEKGLIEKKDCYENNVKKCFYRVVNKVDQSTKFTGGSQLSLQGVSTKFTGGSQLSLHNNIYNTLDNNLIDNIDMGNSEKSELPKTKKKSETFKKPAVEEIESYCKERKNNIDAQYFYDYYESKGWMIGKNKMKDWKASVRTWERNSKKSFNAEHQETKEQYTDEEYMKSANFEMGVY
jgi:stress-induced morphogen